MTSKLQIIKQGDEKTIFKKLHPANLAKKRKILSTPIRAIDLKNAKYTSELVWQMEQASIQARNLGSCAKIWKEMLEDPNRPTIMLGLAGPLIAAGLKKVILDIIERNLADVIVSTGAILYQDIYQAVGFKHYRGTHTADDSMLRDLYIDRIYDTYVDEESFWKLDCSIGRFADTLPPGNYSSREFLRLLGLSINDRQSIVSCAAKYGIPLFSPAINDSSIGIGLTEHRHRCISQGREGVIIDSIRDNYELTQIVVQSKCTAAVYVAGGVPKNYINDSVVMSYIFGVDTGGHRYAIQMTADNPHWGGLSGSTLSEATSWGKVSKRASTAMCFIEPSVSLPLVVSAVYNCGLKRNRLEFKWDGEKLIHLKPVNRRRS